MPHSFLFIHEKFPVSKEKLERTVDELDGLGKAGKHDVPEKKDDRAYKHPSGKGCIGAHVKKCLQVVVLAFSLIEHLPMFGVVAGIAFSARIVDAVIVVRARPFTLRLGLFKQRIPIRLSGRFTRRAHGVFRRCAHHKRGSRKTAHNAPKSSYSERSSRECAEIAAATLSEAAHSSPYVVRSPST